MKPIGRAVLTAIKCRAYGVQTAVKAVPEQWQPLPKQDVQTTRLPNGVVVASVDNYAPVARVGMFYNAGARNESGANVGITHCLRNLGNMSTVRTSAFGIMRTTQQIGASLSVSSTRENMIYTLECMRDNLDTGLGCLSDVAVEPALKPWELKDASERLQLDFAILQQQPESILADCLHKAAYRQNLGNSLYMPEYRVGSYSRSMVVDYLSQYYTSSSVCLAGVGVDHEEMVQYARSFNLPAGSGAAPDRATFYGDEVRQGMASEFARVAIVSEGSSCGSGDALSLAVLQYVMGAGPYVAYSSDVATSLVAKAAARAGSSPVAATCINVSYSDSGLFGFQVITPAADMEKVLKSVVAEFNEATKGSLSEKDIARGKAQFLASAAMNAENSSDLLQQLGTTASMGGTVRSFDELQAAVNEITATDIQNIAKKVINGKPAMAAVGDLSNTPYLDQLL